MALARVVRIIPRPVRDAIYPAADAGRAAAIKRSAVRKLGRAKIMIQTLFTGSKTNPQGPPCRPSDVDEPENRSAAKRLTMQSQQPAVGTNNFSGQEFGFVSAKRDACACRRGAVGIQ